MASHLKFAIYGHHKCATMSLNSIAQAVCRRLGLRYCAVYDEFMFDENLKQFISGKNIEFLLYGNADIKYVQNMHEHRAFHIIRDPRDIVVSAYFSHMNSHSTANWKELRPHRDKLCQLSKDEGIAEEIRFRARSFQHMHSWDYGQENVAEIRFENLASRNYETLLTVFDHLGLLDTSNYTLWKRQTGIYRDVAAFLYKSFKWPHPARIGPRRIPAAEFLTIAWRNRFEAQAQGRGQGDENIHNHYRKGSPGDWRNHFTDDHKGLFKQLYPGLVPSLGYADSDDW